jgi:hypothetical protein
LVLQNLLAVDDRSLGPPNPGKAKSPLLKPRSYKSAGGHRTETIISKNIFDPERGAGFTRQAKRIPRLSTDTKHGLLGTAILGNNRVAILQDGATFC